MTPSLVLCFSLGGWCSGAPPELRPNPIPVLPSLDEDAFRRRELERTRRARDLIESDIELFERLMRNHPEVFTPEKSKRIRETVEKMRNAVEELRQHERKLGGNPDQAIAPMPREVKPKTPAPKP